MSRLMMLGKGRRSVASSPWALVANTSATDTGSGVATGATDTSDAVLLVAIVCYFSGSSHALTDSRGNTWVQTTVREIGGDTAIVLYYCIAPSVGSGHTFTASSGAFASLCVAAFSDSAGTPVFDAENGGTGTSTSPVAGSITPAVDNELVIAGVAVGGGTLSSIDSSFSITDTVAYSGGNHYGGGLARLLQSSAAAVNPTWTASISNSWAATIASFKAL